MRALLIIIVPLLAIACGSPQRPPDNAPKPLSVAPIASGSAPAPKASETIARGEIVVSLMNESGTLVTFSTRHDPTVVARPCIDDPKLAPRPLSPTWLVFSIAIGDSGATTVKLREASANDEAAQKLSSCVTKALERVGNAQALSRGGDEHLLAYVSVR